MGSTCSQLSRSQQEPLIGTAPWTRWFVLVECPHPWAESIAQSKGLPAGLDDVMARWSEAWPRTRFLAFTGERLLSTTTEDSSRRIWVFEAPDQTGPTGPAPLLSNPLRRYRAAQMVVPTAEDLVQGLEDWLAVSFQGQWPSRAQPLPGRHLFVCTHGRRDRCCGRYGYPFYQQAQSWLQTLGLQSTVHLWQVSHIGGHRFAPTLVDLPEGRYYGALTMEDWLALLLHRGSLDRLTRVYRGWSLLPEPAQIVERSLWQHQGWRWMDQPVRFQVQPSLCTKDTWDVQVEIDRGVAVGQPVDPRVNDNYGITRDETLSPELFLGQRRWRAWVDRSPQVIQKILGSCADETPLTLAPYRIKQWVEPVEVAPSPWGRQEAGVRGAIEKPRTNYELVAQASCPRSNKPVVQDLKGEL